MYWRDSVEILRGDSNWRLHARRTFHGKPRFDLVQVTGEDAVTPWFARLVALFDVEVADGWRSLALVAWLDEVLPSHVVGARTWTYMLRRMDVVELECVERPVLMASSPIKMVDDRLCFVQLPYNASLRA